jgi:hypothetical protein
MMKSLRQLSALRWLVVFAGVAAFAPISLGQSEKSPGQEPKSDPLCPTISVSCPSQRELGQPLTFVVTVNGADPEAVLTYTWTTYGGPIIEGQGTPTIKIKAERWKGQSFTATVTIGGLNPACSSTASCSLLPGTPPPPSTRFDSYGVISRKQERGRLETFASALKNNPGAQGYILSYGGRRDVAGAARAAGERAKAYLVKDQGIDAGRIVIVEGGFKEKLTVDLWIVPTGATTPKPEPMVDPGRGQ